MMDDTGRSLNLLSELPGKRLAVFISLLMLAGMNVLSADILNNTKPSAGHTEEQLNVLHQSVTQIINPGDYDELIQRAGEATLVLIGDSTHGSHEFYQQRIEISKRLIQGKNFKMIALEGDWINVAVLDQYIHSTSSSPYIVRQILNVVNPHATWLWNNQEMFHFIEWLKSYNTNLPPDEQKVSLYGIDIYSFEPSKKAVIDYLLQHSRDAAQQALSRYQCFDKFRVNRRVNLYQYGKIVSQNPGLSCEQVVTEQYLDFSKCRYPCPEKQAVLEASHFFNAEQNARIIKNSETSYRSRYVNNDSNTLWNLRDKHMSKTIQAVQKQFEQPKTVVWAHSSHLGDARATQLKEKGVINLGQLLRQHFNEQVYSIGMLTFAGQVLAGDNWQDPAYVKKLLPAHPQSNEALFHKLGIPAFTLNLQEPTEINTLLSQLDYRDISASCIFHKMN